jgi:hypothetical protein
LLFIFPLEQTKPVFKNTNKVWNQWMAVLTAFDFLLLIVVFLFYRQVPLINPTTSFVLLLSILAVLAYLYFATRHLYKVDLYIQSIRNSRVWVRTFVAISILVAVYCVIWWGAGDEPSPLNYKGFLANIVVSAIANPLTFLVSHVVYAGPVLLVLLYFIRPFMEEINNYGVGLHVLILGYVFLSIHSETRLFINAWPFFVAFLCKSLEKIKLPASFYISILLFALALSKFWYRIEVENFSKNYLDFPEQRYFMSIGPWMSDAMYLLQGSIILLISFWLYWLYFRKVKVSS